jgi:hypothetical protein
LTFTVCPETARFFLAFCYWIGSWLKAITFTIFPYAKGIFLAFLLGIGGNRFWRCRFWLMNTIYIDDYSIAVCIADAQNTEISTWLTTMKGRAVICMIFTKAEAKGSKPRRNP